MTSCVLLTLHPLTWNQKFSSLPIIKNFRGPKEIRVIVGNIRIGAFWIARILCGRSSLKTVIRIIETSFRGHRGRPPLASRRIPGLSFVDDRVRHAVIASPKIRIRKVVTIRHDVSIQHHFITLLLIILRLSREILVYTRTDR